MKVALAEMGYGDAVVRVRQDNRRADGTPWVTMSRGVPLEVAWQAFSLTYERMPCWSCWVGNSGSDSVSKACAHDGDCANLGPKRPPRELLVAAS